MTKLFTALVLYAILAGLAFYLLTKERLYVVLLVLGLFAFRTVIAHKAGWVMSRGGQSHSETDVSERNPE